MLQEEDSEMILRSFKEEETERAAAMGDDGKVVEAATTAVAT